MFVRPWSSVFGRWKPGSIQRSTSVLRVARIRIRSACTHASGSSAHSWSSRSPWVRVGSIWSCGKCSIGRSCFGLRSASPNRSSNSDAPTPTVTVRLVGSGSGPRIRLSDGGSNGSRFGAGPPVGEPARGLGEVAQRALDLLAIRRDDVERGDERVGRRVVRDAGLVPTLERDAAVVADGRAGDGQCGPSAARSPGWRRHRDRPRHPGSRAARPSLLNLEARSSRRSRPAPRTGPPSQPSAGHGWRRSPARRTRRCSPACTER